MRIGPYHFFVARIPLRHVREIGLRSWLWGQYVDHQLLTFWLLGIIFGVEDEG